jgi:hypothetical protein
MDKIALLPVDDRAALFGETAAARGVADSIIEKDFWVCWTLKRLFALQKEDVPTLVFKDGNVLVQGVRRYPTLLRGRRPVL